MMKSQDFPIDGKTYNITRYGAREGIGVKIKLGQYLSPISKIFKNFDPKKESILDNDFDLDEVIEAFVMKLDDNTIDFILRMLRPVRVDGAEMTEDVFDQTFAGDYLPLYKLIVKIIEFNCFFGKGSITKMFKKAQILPVKE